MKPEDAERIVNEYGGMMERELGRSGVAPESALPHPKATIREAILTYTAALHKMRALHEIRDTLATGYMQLADFMPDADALHVRRVEETMLSSVEDFAGMPEDETQRWTELKRQAVEEGSLLLAEFRGFEKGIGARDYRVDEIAERRAAKRDVEDMFR